MSKHTPRPWEYRSGLIYGQPVERPGNVSAAKIVAEVKPGAEMGGMGAYDRYPPAMAHANARLIAAAPDLLEAAKEAAGWFQHCELDPACGVCPYCITSAAIAKAEGVEP